MFLLSGCFGSSGSIDEPTFTIGGTISDLHAEGLELTLAGNDQSITLSAGDGEFAFPGKVVDNTAYEVNISAQPEDPIRQACTIQNATGVVSGEDIATITVNCPFQPWATRMHHGNLRVASEDGGVRVSWPDTGADYTLYLTTNADTDLRNPASFGAIPVPAATSNHLFEAIAPDTNVYIALTANGVLHSWTAARPGSVTGFNDRVATIAVDPETGTQYIGGDFTRITTLSDSAVTLPGATPGGPDHALAHPGIDGEILAAIADGEGGWYIGGDFTHIGGAARHNLAQIDARGKVTDWAPNANNTVRALALADDVVYAGGTFTTVNGATRNRLAAITNEGDVTDWNPGTGGVYVEPSVDALIVADGIVYAGGNFTTVDGQQRKYLAGINTNGTLSDWDPDADAKVFALAFADDVIYAGGHFSEIGEHARRRLAAIDTEGKVTDWSIFVDGGPVPVNVFALTVADGIIYVGGTFTSVSDHERRRLAAIDTAGKVTAWNPLPGSPRFDSIHTLTTANGVIYAGGARYYASEATRPASSLVAIDTEGELLDWDPGIYSDRINEGGVHAVAVADGVVFAGGDFTSLGGQTRNHLAAIDIDGNLTGWNPDASDRVSALAVADSVVYVAGGGSSIGDQARSGLAAIDADSNVTDWHPEVDGGGVITLAVADQTVYAGGNFSSVDGQSRNRLAAITADGTLTEWNPQANDTVNALTAGNNRIYAGGAFNFVAGGVPRDHLAAFDLNGSVKSWNPGANNTVLALTLDDEVLYASGFFSSVGEKNRWRLAAIDSDGKVADWNPDQSNTARTLTSADGVVYVGGSAPVGIDADGDILDWNPSLGGTVRALAAANNKIYAGGDFGLVNGLPRDNFATLDTEGELVD